MTDRLECMAVWRRLEEGAVDTELRFTCCRAVRMRAVFEKVWHAAVEERRGSEGEIKRWSIMKMLWEEEKNGGGEQCAMKWFAKIDELS